MNLDDVKNPKELGDYLKNLRLKKNISLEEINQETKIRIKYLNAIEEGNFDAIPGGEVYLKGFLKNYAEAVGINSNEILKKYKEISAPKSQEFQQENTAVKKDRRLIIDEERPKSKVPKIPLLLVGLVFVIALTTLSFLKTQPDTSLEPPKTTVNSDLPSENDTSPTLETEEERKEELLNQISLASDDGRNITYTVSGNSINVKFEVINDRCWIRVNSDGIVTFEGTLNKGESKSFEAKNKLTIKIGNPPVVKVTLNGKEIEIPGNYPKTLLIMRNQ
ncbi:Cytoskeleton protein RodZ [Fervidicola ferrireducens]|uniref:Cytoskeleton protein RodZ n=1 Tax=Fervidicola ferrireducens TaxID=520764 RepID=A0A140L8N1_9FIRM|nr:RodZ domain-containing protein [Fervidicola ferrireducens]KXG76906.1 Cytoskeleton protein RodZ [Fervidicola ferrireducens]